MSTIPSSQIDTLIITSSSSLAPIFSTSPMINSPIGVEIHVSQSQHDPLVTPQQETISISEHMAEFGKDVVVSMGKHFWSRKYKANDEKGNQEDKGRYIQIGAYSQPSYL